MMKKVE